MQAVTATGFLATDAVRHHHCSRCGAGQGALCRRPSGRPYSEVHTERTAQAARCPECGPAARRSGPANWVTVERRVRARTVLMLGERIRAAGRLAGPGAEDFERILVAAEALAKDVLGAT